jgi:hypothetical protein
MYRSIKPIQRKARPMAISPTEIEKFIEGVHYPASKYDLNRKARENHAPDMIIDYINNLLEHRFNSPAEVDRAIRNTE